MGLKLKKVIPILIFPKIVVFNMRLNNYPKNGIVYFEIMENIAFKIASQMSMVYALQSNIFGKENNKTTGGNSEFEL